MNSIITPASDMRQNGFILHKRNKQKHNQSIRFVIISCMSALFLAPSYGEVLFHDDFNSGIASKKWVSIRCCQQVNNGWFYTQNTSGSMDSLAIVHDKDSSWKDYKLTMKAQFASDLDAVGQINIVLRSNGFNRGPYVSEGWGYQLEFFSSKWNPPNGKISLTRSQKGTDNVSLFENSNITPLPVDGPPFNLEVIISGANIRLSVNGSPIFNLTDPNPLPYGGVGIHTIWTQPAKFDDITVSTITSSASAPPTTSRLSLTNGNRQANADNYAPALSADGRYIAFASDATNLVSGDTNNATDIFLRDRVAQTVKLITKGGNGDSLRPAISANGRYVAYESTASNLAEGDTNNASDIFRYDRVTGTTVRVSVASGGAQGDGDSISAALSDDGSRVAFASTAGNLVSGDTNNAFDVFVRDVAEDSTARASVGLANAQGNGDSVMPALSGDGRHVAFASSTTNLVDGDTNGRYDIFLRNTQASTTARVSVRTGASTQEANRDSWQPQLSADGSLVVFASDASNLVAVDRNQATDIFIRNLATNSTYCLSRTDQGKEANAPSYRPRISGSGRYVAFQSDAALTAADTNQAADVYLIDRATHKLARISVATDGTQGDGQSLAPALSADGRYVVFESDSANLVKGDTNQAWDIFVRDMGKGLAPSYPLSARKTAPAE